MAARYSDGAASDKDLAAARTAAQEAQAEAKEAEYVAEAEANFCMTPAYAATCRNLVAASAARSAVCQDPGQSDVGPGSHEANYWLSSHRSSAAAVSFEVRANFESDLSDSQWEQAGDAGNAAETAELRAHCDLLRDIFGTFLGPPDEEGHWLPSGLAARDHPLSHYEQWCHLPSRRKVGLPAEGFARNGSTILQLARAIYEEEAFERLPVLADALEEVGCTDADLLSHLRGPGPHVRGCWALDAVLGKS